MKHKQVDSYDGITLNYAVEDTATGKPWIVFILPFGMPTSMAQAFFDFFEPQYQIICWEARSILEESDRKVAVNEFSIDNHLRDARTVLDDQAVSRAIFVGYCSGAGIAVALANRYPDLVERLILVHGEFVLLEHEGCTTQFSREIDTLLSLAVHDEKRLNMVFDKVGSERFENAAGRPEGIDLPFSALSYFRRYAANYVEYKSVPFLELARNVSHDTLLMCGEIDTQTNVASAQQLKTMMPQAHIFIDPGADHYGILREESGTLVKIWNYLCQNRVAA